MGVNRRRIGKEKEQIAGEYLRKQGYQILHTNYWSRFAELDLVAKEGEELVFVEVKYRKNGACGESLQAMTPLKMERMFRCAEYFILRENIPADTPMRFDVIGIDGDRITHIKNAFEGT